MMYLNKTLKRIIRFIKRNSIRKLLLWIYSCYITLRYIDNYKKFPAIKFDNLIKIKISKGKNSKININNKLIISGFFNRNDDIVIIMGSNSEINIINDFTIGNNISLYLSENAKLLLKGKKNESASGITSDSKVMVHNYVEIGYDCIIAWNTYITDCDWHGIEGKIPNKNTIISDHVWIGVGVNVLKGSIIGKNSIVTTNTITTNKEYPENALICGHSGEIKKNNISNWKRNMY